MAQYRGEIHGGKGSVSRLGTKASGLRVYGNGWNIGAEVVLSYYSSRSFNQKRGLDDAEDHVLIRLTSGSGSGPVIPLGVFSRRDLEDLSEGKKEFRLVDLPQSRKGGE